MAYTAGYLRKIANYLNQGGLGGTVDTPKKRDALYTALAAELESESENKYKAESVALQGRELDITKEYKEKEYGLSEKKLALEEEWEKASQALEQKKVDLTEAYNKWQEEHGEWEESFSEEKLAWEKESYERSQSFTEESTARTQSLAEETAAWQKSFEESKLAWEKDYSEKKLEWEKESEQAKLDASNKAAAASSAANWASIGIAGAGLGLTVADKLGAFGTSSSDTLNKALTALLLKDSQTNIPSTNLVGSVGNLDPYGLAGFGGLGDYNLGELNFDFGEFDFGSFGDFGSASSWGGMNFDFGFDAADSWDYWNWGSDFDWDLGGDLSGMIGAM